MHSTWPEMLRAAALAAVFATVQHAPALNLRTEFVADGPSETMFLTAPVGDANHFYTGGRRTMDVWIHDRATGQMLGNYLNLPNATQGAQDGLLSLAFHPDFQTNGFFYTYTFRNDDPIIRVTEHKRSDTDPLVADPNYERQILEIPNPTKSHNGGWLGFSPIDGYLYVTVGDGGALPTPDSGLPAQDPFDLHGKLLRVDVDADDFPTDATKNYAIPASNPFDGTDALPEIFALGLRHTFRASFDRQTGDLYLGDLGGTQFDEINFIPAGSPGGENFGWRALEGSQDNPFVDDPAPPDAIDPIYEYPNIGGAAVIAGHVYRGAEIPDFQGNFLFGDFATKELFSFAYDGTNLTDFKDRTAELFPDGFGRVVAIGEDGLGELYVVDILRSEVHRVLEVPPLAADYNGDGFVDAADYVLWRDNEGAPAGTLENDIDGGTIGGAQYISWTNRYGDDFTSVLAVPEPTAMTLAVFAWAGAAHRRRGSRP